MANTSIITPPLEPSSAPSNPERFVPDPHDNTTNGKAHAEVTAPIKRGRGRPPKAHPVHEDAPPPRRKAAKVLPIPDPDEEDDDDEIRERLRLNAEEAPTEQPASEDNREHELALKSDLLYWLDNLSDDVWATAMVYAYRKEPVWIADKTGGKPHYIQKMSQRFTAEDLKRMHGSGLYRIDVTIALPKGGSHRLRTGTVHIMDPNYPPNLPVSDAWTKNPINERWFWAIPILESRERQSASMKGGPQPNIPHEHKVSQHHSNMPPAADDDAAGLVGLARRSQEQLMALSDPTRQLDTVQKIIEMVRPTAAAAPATDSAAPMFTMLFNMVREENKEMRAELRELRRAATEPRNAGQDAKTIINDALEIAETLGFTRSKGSHDKTDPWVSFLDRVIDQAPVIAEMFIAANRPAVAPQAAQAQAQIQQQQRPQPEEEDEEEDTPEMTQQELRQQETMERLEPLIRNSIEPMMKAVSSKSPATLKRWFLDEYGRTNFEALKLNIGAERMAHMTTTHPLLRTQLPGKAEMQAFFNEVFG